MKESKSMFSMQDFDEMEQQWEAHEASGFCMCGNWLPRKNEPCGNEAEYEVLDRDEEGNWSTTHRGMPICEWHMHMMRSRLDAESTIYFGEFFVLENGDN